MTAPLVELPDLSAFQFFNPILDTNYTAEPPILEPVATSNDLWAQPTEVIAPRPLFQRPSQLPDAVQGAATHKKMSSRKTFAQRKQELRRRRFDTGRGLLRPST